MRHQCKLWKVAADNAGMRLQSFLKEQLGSQYSGKQIKHWIDQYRCRVNGKLELFSSYKIKRGDSIQLDVAESLKPSKSSLQILYEDEVLLICNKPCGLVCQPDTINKISGLGQCFLVHRLDKDTTGAFILAKNSAVQKQLEQAFRNQTIHKVYHALVQGSSREHQFNVENHLGKLSQYDGQAIWGAVPKGGGVYASTQFEVLKRASGCALLQCIPITGRTHQIRVHLKEKGLPILGDCHYFRDHPFIYPAQRPLLHSYLLTMTHPLTGQLLTITAPYPQDFLNALAELF